MIDKLKIAIYKFKEILFNVLSFLSNGEVQKLLIVILIFGGAYIWNFIKLTNCDYDAPYKCEVIHAIGLMPPLQILTVWFDDDKKK